MWATGGKEKSLFAYGRDLTQGLLAWQLVPIGMPQRKYIRVLCEKDTN